MGKFINEPINGTTEQMYALSTEDLRQLARLLKPVETKLRKRLEKYIDIQDSGEATDRQQTAMFNTQDDLILVQGIINSVK